jgi:pantothenate kinase
VNVVDSARDALAPAALADRAAALVPDSGRAILGIVGAPGSGKSTLAEQLLAALRARHGAEWVAHVPMDGYHLADAQLRRLGSLARKGAPDTFDAAGYAHLLSRVRTAPDEWIYVPGFERELEQPIAAALVVPPTARLIVTEGNYLLLDAPGWRSARGKLDEVWFVVTDPAVRRERLVARHIRFGKAPDAARDWVRRVDEPNAVLIGAGAARADLVVENAADGWRVVGAS